MPVTFVTGRAGSGKTERLIRRLIASVRQDPLGPPLLWIVPKQATFSAERELTCRLGAFTRVRILSFDQLAKWIGESCGEPVIPQVTELGRRLIIGHLLRLNQPRLRYFGGVANRPGLAAEVDATFSEIERAGKSSSDFSEFAKSLRPSEAESVDGSGLSDKVHDLALLHDAYSRYMGQERLDQHRRMELACGQLEQCRLLHNAFACVDGFLHFSNHERRILVGLAKACRGVEINLLLDPAANILRDPHPMPDELGLFHRTEVTYRKIWFAFNEAHIQVKPPVRLWETRRFADDRLSDLERRAFERERVSGDGNGDEPNLFSVAREVNVARQTGSIGGQCPPYQDRSTNGCSSASSSSPGTPGEGGVRAELWSAQSRTEDSYPPSTGVPREGLVQPQSITLLEAPNPRAEVDAVARQILSLLRQGRRLRDVLVLARDLTPYHDLIAASFREHDIPYFVDRRRPAGHHPLLGFVRSALRIARVGWPLQTVLDFLRTGLAGVSPSEADDVENYLLRHRLANVAWDEAAEWRFVAPYSADPTAPSRVTERIRRQVAKRVMPLIDRVRSPERSTVREYAAEVFSLLEVFGVRATLAGWMEAAEKRGDIELRGEHEQAWAAMVDLFEQMVDLLGDEPVTPTDFIDVLESGLEQFDFALTPPTVDQVLVGEVERTRTASGRAVFIIGLNEGWFPKTAQDQSVLTGADRRELQRRKLELDADPTRRQLDERLLAYLAFTRASDRLVLTRPKADAAGRQTAPSPFWQEIQRIAPDAPLALAPRAGDDDIAHIAIPAALIASLMRWANDMARISNSEFRISDKDPRPSSGEAGVQSPGEPGAGESILSRKSEIGNHSEVGFRDSELRFSVLAPLYQWLVARPVDNDHTGRLRYRAWRALSYRNAAVISPDVAAKLFASPLRASASQLEAQAQCPFRHFVRYGLGLHERQGNELSAIDMSRVYHDVLNDVLAEVVAGGSRLRDLSPTVAAELIRRFAAAVAERLRGEVMLASARNQYLLSRIERTIQQVVGSLREMLGRGAFDARQPSVSFGDEAKLPACVVKTPSGRELRLSGRIDRIDVVPEGPHAGAMAVFDYKLGSQALSLQDVYHGLSLQLLAGLMALESVGQTITGRVPKPAAAFYCQLSRGLQQVDHPDEAADPASAEFLLRHKPRGVFDARFFESLDANAQNNEWSKVIQAHLKSDGHFGNRAKSDVADPADFTTLLSFVRGRMGQIADEIMGGKIDVSPYRIGQNSPCPNCEYRAICRFEPSVDGYRFLPSMNRLQVLDTICGRCNGA